MQSPDANKILNLAVAQHPRLRPLALELAANPKVRFDYAVYELAMHMHKLGLNSLDIEMCQPEAMVRVPFETHQKPEQNSFVTAIEDARRAKYGTKPSSASQKDKSGG